MDDPLRDYEMLEELGSKFTDTSEPTGNRRS